MWVISWTEVVPYLLDGLGSRMARKWASASSGGSSSPIMVASLNGSSPLSTRLAWSESDSPTQLPIRTVATALPEKL